MKYLIIVLFCLSTSVQASDTMPGLVPRQPESGRFVKTDQGFMVPYEMSIPGTDVVFALEPIPGGQITVGSDHRKYFIGPFWMGRFEVTWSEYKQFMNLYHVFKQFQINRQRTVNDDNEIDAVTAPTPLYEPTYTFEFGDDPRQPAVTITQYAARQYTKWLSAVTGLQYRLPAEAEWEHACRAGATTAYHFGKSPGDLSEFGWFKGAADTKGAQIVGQKRPNSWGLYDMHGNAAEWVLDGPDGSSAAEGATILDASTEWIRSQTPDHRKVCGGSWEFPATDCTSTSRLLSVHAEWKFTDPNIPKSPWWFTDDPARGVGFRIMRALKSVDRKQMEEYWKIDNESIGWDVFDRIDEGRGVKGLVDLALPQAITDLTQGK
ncbi:MAG: formylglycine-generating enzyme family protein [Fuerstiella sp.]|nr:formylglycine-generating enzyme family protein [Fuerstiella sp.]